MRTGDTVTGLGLYISDCCDVERIFDTGDTFQRCPRCNGLCVWEFEEEIVTAEDEEHVDGAAA
jgi:hypothetical protein